MAAIDWARLDELDRLLGTAFGPGGRAVLSRNPTGQMAVTRSGIGILRAVYAEGDTPFMKTIVGFADGVERSLGDGVKSFVFTVAALLKRFRDADGKSRICRQLGVLQSGLAMLTIKSEQKCKPNEDCLFSNVVRSFFYTRFAGSVGSFLSSFLHEWISVSLACTCVGNPSEISTLCKDVSNLCSYENGASRSVTESYMKNGFFISGRVFNVKKSGPRKIIVALFNDSDAEDGKFDGSDVECEIKRLLLDLKRERCQEVCLRSEVLLLSSQVLSDLTLFNLGRENLGVVDGVPLEEIKFLSGKISGELHKDSKNPNGLVFNVSLCKGHILIELPAIQQMFLCGPTKELRLEYALACRSALRLLAVTNESTLSNLCTKGGGHFERTLHQKISVSLDKFNNAVPQLGSRAELLNWHRLKLSQETAEPNELDRACTKISKVFSCLDREVLDSVLQGILAVPRKLAQDGVESVAATEPLSLRLGILMHALSAVIALLRCDRVIFSKKPCL